MITKLASDDQKPPFIPEQRKVAAGVRPAGAECGTAAFFLSLLPRSLPSTISAPAALEQGWRRSATPLAVRPSASARNTYLKNYPCGRRCRAGRGGIVCRAPPLPHKDRSRAGQDSAENMQHAGARNGTNGVPEGGGSAQLTRGASKARRSGEATRREAGTAERSGRRAGRRAGRPQAGAARPSVALTPASWTGGPGRVGPAGPFQASLACLPYTYCLETRREDGKRAHLTLAARFCLPRTPG